MESPLIKKTLDTKWYHYLLAFFAAIFATNVLPHYVNGISGKSFPTPFADPPGVGLSGPELNILWATINLALSFVIFFFSKILKRTNFIWIPLILGFLLMSFYLAHYFGKIFIRVI